MRKAVAGILLLCVCILFLGTAHAQEHAAFSIVRQHLLEHVADASALSRAEIGGIIGDLARSGYAVPEDACGEKANAYDVAMDILQAVLGSYYDWTIEERHGFDRMMVDCGELDRCYNLLPGDGEIAKEDAQRIALGEIASRYALDPSQLDRVSSLSVSYVRAEGSASGGKWRFGVALQNQMSFGVEVTDGVVTRCEKYRPLRHTAFACRSLGRCRRTRRVPLLLTRWPRRLASRGKTVPGSATRSSGRRMGRISGGSSSGIPGTPNI